MMKTALSIAAAAALLLGPGLQAQAPAITQQGDPSIDADTIYRLATPASDTGRYVTMLFEDQVIRVASDYRLTTTHRSVFRRLVPADTFPNKGYQFASTGPDESVRLNWARVIGPDGAVVAQGAPQQVRKGEVFDERQTWLVDLPKLRRGDILDLSYTLTEAKPPAAREFFGEFQPENVRRYRVVLDVPATMQLRITEEYLQARRRESTAGGRRTYTWTAHDLGRRLWEGSDAEDREGVVEAYAPDSLTRHPSVRVSGGTTWKRVGEEFRASIPRNAYHFDKVAMEHFDEDTFLHLADSFIDTISTVHGWLALDYDADLDRQGFGTIELGRVANVLARDTTRKGTQEERIMLFIAAARAHGIKAYPVMMGSYSTDSMHPARAQLTHLGAWVATKNAQVPFLYLDPSTRQSYFRSDPPKAQQGQFGLVIHDDSIQHITIPRSVPAQNAVVTTLIGTVARDGSLSGRMRYEARGTQGYELNDEMEYSYNAKTNFGWDVATSLYPGMTADSIKTIGPWMQDPNPYVAAVVKVPSIGTRRGSTFVLDLFWKPITGLDSLAAQLERTPRRMPFDAETVVGNTARLDAISVKLPAGWKARLPRPVSAESPFGTFKTTYEQKGETLTVSRLFLGAQGVLGPEKLPELVRWLRQVASDQTQTIVIDAP